MKTRSLECPDCGGTGSTPIFTCLRCGGEGLLMDRGVEFCSLCDEPLLPGDAISPSTVNGKPVHHECAFRAIVGGANHILRRCSCCGGTEPPDPPGLTPRQAAREAMRAFNLMNPNLPPVPFE